MNTVRCAAIVDMVNGDAATIGLKHDLVDAPPQSVNVVRRGLRGPVHQAANAKRAIRRQRLTEALEGCVCGQATRCGVKVDLNADDPSTLRATGKPANASTAAKIAGVQSMLRTR